MAVKRVEQKLISAKDLARELKCDRRTIAKWQDDGLPVARRGKGGRPSLYDLEECRAWVEARNQLSNSDGPIDLLHERARKERAQALLAEQLYAVRARSLLPADEVEKRWAAEIIAARAVILSAYTAASDRVYRAATTDGLAGVERELRVLAHAVLRELANPTPTKTKRSRKRAA